MKNYVLHYNGVGNITDLEKNEIIKNSRNEHARFVSLENTEADAEKVCNQLVEAGFQAATFQREDNHLWEVFQKFSPAEECMYILEQKCEGCLSKDTTECSPKSCKTKSSIEDILWKESRGFISLLRHDLKRLRAE